jgi:hypothetical protein
MFIGSDYIPPIFVHLSLIGLVIFSFTSFFTKNINVTVFYVVLMTLFFIVALKVTYNLAILEPETSFKLFRIYHPLSPELIFKKTIKDLTVLYHLDPRVISSIEKMFPSYLSEGAYKTLNSDDLRVFCLNILKDHQNLVMNKFKDVSANQELLNALNAVSSKAPQKDVSTFVYYKDRVINYMVEHKGITLGIALVCALLIGMTYENITDHPIIPPPPGTTGQ